MILVVVVLWLLVFMVLVVVLMFSFFRWVMSDDMLFSCALLMLRRVCVFLVVDW